MTTHVKSARGQIVDFDLLRIKQQISTAPKNTTVQAREDFIDQKLKRRLKKINRTAAETNESEDSITPETP